MIALTKKTQPLNRKKVFEPNSSKTLAIAVLKDILVSVCCEHILVTLSVLAVLLFGSQWGEKEPAKHLLLHRF